MVDTLNVVPVTGVESEDAADRIYFIYNGVDLYARIEKATDEPETIGIVECRERLGGVLKYYYRRAACSWDE